MMAPVLDDVDKRLVRVIVGAGDDDRPDRECTKCGEVKPAADFGKVATGAQSTVCRTCRGKANSFAHSLATSPRELALIAVDVGLALEANDTKDADGNVIEDDDEPFVAGSIWDLSKPETVGRLGVACLRAYRAYMRNLEARGLTEDRRGASATGVREVAAIEAGLDGEERPATRVAARKETSMGAQTEEQKKNQSERRRAILDYLRKSGPTDGPALREVLGLSVGEWTRISAFLREAGELAVTGTKRAARWHLPGQKVEAGPGVAPSKPRAKREASTAKLQRQSLNGKANGSHPAPAGDLGNAIEVLAAKRNAMAEELSRVDRALAVLRGEA